jgi:hypothetical protein
VNKYGGQFIREAKVYYIRLTVVILSCQYESVPTSVRMTVVSLLMLNSVPILSFFLYFGLINLKP